MCKEGGGWEGDWVFYMIERGWAILDWTNFYIVGSHFGVILVTGGAETK